MKAPALSLEKVSIDYDGKSVLHDVTCSFPYHAVTGLLGPSGSGKSTLLRSVCRMNDRIPGFRLRGEVTVLGRDIYGNGVDVYALRRRVGLIFQKPCVFPKSIYENVLFGLRHHHPEKKNEFPGLAEQALRKAFLWEEVKDRLHDAAPTLSQGQQHRLAIARTLAVDPEVLLMDEPTSALDARSTRALEDLILSLKAEHTLILVTHNLDQAERVCDSILCLNEGAVVEENLNGPRG